MTSATRMIEVDEVTATALERQASELGITVAELVAELVPTSLDPPAMDELERRWARVAAGEVTVPHEEVERWLATWGTSGFRRWRER